MFSHYPVLILAGPLAAGLIIGLLGRAIGPRAARIGVAAKVISFALSLLVLYEVTTRGSQSIHLSSWNDGILQFGLHIDRLSSVMLVHIAAISLLIHLFSIRYMQQESGYTRFHSLLSFTGFVLFGMVSSANLLILFIFWQLLSWLVPLLSHNHSHPLTVRGAFRTFVIQRIVDDLERGDVPLDQSIKIYERGEALKAHCDRLLKAAEDKVEKIRLSRDGKPIGTEPLDAE